MNSHRSGVFLSASFPAGERADHFPPSDPASMADAIVALSREILRRNGLIVCGGHPTITPLLLYVCAEQGARDSLIVYQSERFRDAVPEETHRLSEEGWATLRFTASTGDRVRDLETMRIEMLSDRPLIGGIFVGGMEGILDEYTLFESYAPGSPRFALAAPGGAAATLVSASFPFDLASPRYPVVARQVVNSLGL
ncbi:MAG: hypothetical protein U0R51_01655 [Solirubrobacterales bacterium]